MKFSTITIDSIMNTSFIYIDKELDESNWMQYVEDNKKLFFIKNGNPYVVHHDTLANNFQSKVVKTILCNSNIQEALDIIGSDPIALIKDEKGTFIGYITQHHIAKQLRVEYGKLNAY